MGCTRRPDRGHDRGSCAREAVPAAHITLLSTPLMREICPPGTLANKLIPYEQHRDRFSVVRRLRRERFDLAVNLRWTSERSALLAFLSGAKERAGSGPPSMRFLYTMKPPPRTGRRHEFLRNVDIVEAAGIPPQRILPFVAVPDLDRRLGAEAWERLGTPQGTDRGNPPRCQQALESLAGAGVRRSCPPPCRAPSCRRHLGPRREGARGTGCRTGRTGRRAGPADAPRGRPRRTDRALRSAFSAITPGR